MLSIEDIKNVSFRRANFGGYKPEDVDTFIDDVQETYKELLREKEELLATISKLGQRIDKFHEEESSIRSMILGAQKIAKKSLSETEEKATEMIKKAVSTSKKLISDAKKEVAMHTEISDTLRKEAEKLKKHLAGIYEQHMKLINTITSDALPRSEKSVDEKTEKEKTEAVFIKEFRDELKEYIPPVASPDSLTKFNPLNECEVASVAAGKSEEGSMTDVFSSEPEISESPKTKFKDLKFGKDYSVENEVALEAPEKKEKSYGIYKGLFRKRK